RRAGQSAVRLTCPARFRLTADGRAGWLPYFTKYQFSGLIDNVDDCGVTPGTLFDASVQLAVEVQGERREHQGDRRGRDEGPGDSAAGAAGVVHQVPSRVGDVADPVGPDEGLEPAGHGARLDEDVAGQRRRPQDRGAKGPHGCRIAAAM